MKHATHFLYPHHYKVSKNTVLIWKSRTWKPSAYHVAGYFLLQPDLVDLKSRKTDPAANFMQDYGLRRSQVDKMLADGVLKID
jgi:hypothetical protein